MAMVEQEVKIKIEKRTVATILADRCTNCGTCRDYCPVDAISEKQKEICHMCPDCTEFKAITVDAMRAMQSEACTTACPLGISPQGYINLIKAGKELEAFELIWNKNPLPVVCGYVCHHPCEQSCKRGTLVDHPMEIRALKRYLGSKFIDYRPAAYPVYNDERIAVIGAGPAGLTAAHYLSQKGYQVTVFEQSAEAGGMLLRGIPEFRIDKEMARKEIKRLEEAGIEIRYNTKVGQNPTVEELLAKFDRIVVASGTQIPKRLPIEGWRTEQVMYAIQLMEKVNGGQKVCLSGQVVVLGGGSVAVDTARTARRLGAEKVTMLCLESGSCVPAHSWELAEAREEGIELIEGVAPKRMLGHTSHLEGLEYVPIKNLKTEGGFSYDEIYGEEKTIPADILIIAIGNASDKTWPKDERIVFAGDVTSAACSVVDAMAAGRAAAVQIDNELRSRDYAEYEMTHTVSAGSRDYKVYPANRRKLQFPEIRKLSVDARLGGFALVEQGMTGDEAMLETYRCLECGYHTVDAARCIGCGVCQKVCPKGDVIVMAAVAADQEVK